MPSFMLFFVILLPILAGVGLYFMPFKNTVQRQVYLEIMIIINSILVWVLLLNRPEGVFTLANFTGNLTIQFKIDGLSMIFAGLVATLWPLATLYAFEYMEKEEHRRIFFMFYTVTYGITLGIALSANILTMYFFYEMLTLVTTPLVMHTLSREAILASRKYLYYSLGGAAFAFIGMIFITSYGTGQGFVMGGTLDMAKMSGRTDILLLVYVFAFFGFGVKAAIWPFNAWLPQAGVAPTPVTALLHAVAVVKAGAFATMRLTYYCFGTEILRGTWAQNIIMIFVMFTIVYGCSRAIKETHIKRRLAYSTISNLSYILFGVVLMSPAGLVGALCHMVFHAVMKICSFFCAGSIMHMTEKHYVHQLDGCGWKMPKVFGIFTVSAMALMGVPGLCGFISKYYLASAAVQSENRLAYIGIGCLLLSALLTAIYMLTIVVRAFFPGKDFDYRTVENVKDPSWKMLLPLSVFVVVMVYFGLYSQPIVALFSQIASGSM